VVIHIGIAMWFHSHFFAPYVHNVMKTPAMVAKRFLPSTDEPISALMWSDDYTRILQVNSLPFAIILVLILVVVIGVIPIWRLFNKLLIKGVLGEVLGFKACLACRGAQVAPAPMPEFLDVVTTRTYHGPATFSIMQQDMYYTNFLAAGKTATELGIDSGALALGTAGLSPASATWYSPDMERVQKKLQERK